MHPAAATATANGPAILPHLDAVFTALVRMEQEVGDDSQLPLLLPYLFVQAGLVHRCPRARVRVTLKEPALESRVLPETVLLMHPRPDAEPSNPARKQGRGNAPRPWRSLCCFRLLEPCRSLAPLEATLSNGDVLAATYADVADDVLGLLRTLVDT